MRRLPAAVVALGKVGAQVNAACFLALAGGLDDQPRDGEHVLQFPAVGVGKLPLEHVSTPAIDRFGRLGQTLGVAADAGTAAQRGF